MSSKKKTPSELLKSKQCAKILDFLHLKGRLVWWCPASGEKRARVVDIISEDNIVIMLMTIDNGRLQRTFIRCHINTIVLVTEKEVIKNNSLYYDPYIGLI